MKKLGKRTLGRKETISMYETCSGACNNNCSGCECSGGSEGYYSTSRSAFSTYSSHYTNGYSVYG